MPDGSESPSRRTYALVLIVGLAMLASPLWMPLFHLNDPTVTYERETVVVDDEAGISYESEDVPTMHTPISEDLGCTLPFETYRLCAYERHLQASNASIPAGWTTGTDDDPAMSNLGRYEYVQLDGETYRPTTTVNESVQSENGYYRIELSLEPVAHEEVLDAISVPAESAGDDVPAVVRRALEDGTATTYRTVEAPATIFEGDDERYYRVYRAGSTRPARSIALLETLLVVLLTGIGFGIASVSAISIHESSNGDQGGRDP